MASPVRAWDDCPHGEVNDPYPGTCAKYIDTDEDGLCDHSQPAPEDRVESTTSENVTKTTNEQAETTPPTESDEQEEEYSVEISGQEMKKLTVQEIADRWGIDAETFLQSMIDEFSLKGDYSTSDTIDTLREEYKFSPAQIKDNAEDILNTGTYAIQPKDSQEAVPTDQRKDNKNLIGLIVLTTPLTLLGGYVIFNKVKWAFHK